MGGDIEELKLLLDVVWDFVSTQFTIYGYTFSYAQIIVAGPVISWGVWAYMQWLDV